MSTLQEVKKRIKSVEKTKKITNAMQMVAAAKLYKASDKLNKARDLFEEVYSIVSNLNVFMFPQENILWQGKPEVKKIGIVVISSDKGLCGSSNTFIMQKMNNFIELKKNVNIVMIGKKGIAYAKKRNLPLIMEKQDFLSDVSQEMVDAFYAEIKKLYLEDQVDEIHLLYNKFFSRMTQKPVIKRLFPIFPLEVFSGDNLKQKSLDYLLEPSEGAVIDKMIEMFAKSFIYKAFCESVVSEESARMNAMRSATDNAEKMIAELVLSFNRVRQAVITKEIVEIISAVEALG